MRHRAAFGALAVDDSLEKPGCVLGVHADAPWFPPNAKLSGRGPERLPTRKRRSRPPVHCSAWLGHTGIFSPVACNGLQSQHASAKALKEINAIKRCVEFVLQGLCRRLVEGR